MARDPHIDKLINDLKAKKFREGEAKDLTKTYGEEISKQIKPLFEAHSKDFSEKSSQAFQNAIKDLKIEVPAQEKQDFPEIPAPIVNIPAPVVNIPAPVVNVPAPIVNVTEREIPEYPEFPTEFSIKGLNPKNPLPVQMVDMAGKPYFPQDSTNVGGRGDFFTIKDIQTSSGASLIDQTEGALKVTGSFSVTSSNASTQLIDSSLNPFGTAANPLNVAITSGASSSTKAQIGNSDGDFSQANPLPVTFSAAASQNVNLFDASASAITSHQGKVEDFRGIDVTQLGVINVQSALNSTTANLGIGGTFTGTAEDVKDYASMSFLVFTDQASATDGFQVQQSGDGTNWDGVDSYTLPAMAAGQGKLISVQPAARYMRVVYTNGGTGQGAFRLYPTFHYSAAQPSSQRSSDSYTNETDLQQFWGFLSALNGTTGSWDRLRSNSGEGNALRVQLATDSVASVNIVSDSGDSIQVTQVSGTIDSVNLTQIGGAAVATGLNETNTGVLRTVQMTDSNSSVNVTQFNGTAPATGLNEVTNGVLRTYAVTSSVDSVNVVTFNGNAPATGLNETNAGVLRAVLMTDSNSSVNVTTFNGNAPATGLNETTNGVLRTIQMTDSVSSVNVTNSTLGVNMIGGGNDSIFTFQARTTNPTAVADSADVRPKADKLGKLLTRPIHVREMIATAITNLTNGTETALLAATSTEFHDLIMITATNQSTAATILEVRENTGGTVVHTMYLPAQTGPVGFAPAVPWPQASIGTTWTVDLPDITGTTVNITALFSREL